MPFCQVSRLWHGAWVDYYQCDHKNRFHNKNPFPFWCEYNELSDRTFHRILKGRFSLFINGCHAVSRVLQRVLQSYSGQQQLKASHAAAHWVIGHHYGNEASTWVYIPLEWCHLLSRRHCLSIRWSTERERTSITGRQYCGVRVSSILAK